MIHVHAEAAKNSKIVMDKIYSLFIQNEPNQIKNARLSKARLKTGGLDKVIWLNPLVNFRRSFNGTK